MGDKGAKMKQERMSIKEYRELIKTPKKSKYNAKKTKIDGHTFDSQKEAEYYKELDLLLNAGEIKWFCLQPIFILSEGVEYRADFIVLDKNNEVHIIDVKGFKTQVYKMKKKLLKNKFGINLEEK